MKGRGFLKSEKNSEWILLQIKSVIHVHSLIDGLKGFVNDGAVHGE